MERRINVGIVILNYNGWQDTIDCVESCKEYLTSNKYNIKIYLIDNASTDDSLKELNNSLKDSVELLVSSKNVGYAAGNNIALKEARKDCDFICVLNNDTVVDEDIILPCIEYLKEHSEVAFIGPTIVNYDDGKVQSTGGSINVKALRKTTQHMNEGKSISEIDEVCDCDYVEGACIIFKTKILDELGYIPEAYFLFSEETEWCYKAKKKGYRNVCLGTIKLRHKGTVSINKINGLSEYLLCRNQIRFLRRNNENTLQSFRTLLCVCLYAICSVPFRGVGRAKQVKYYLDGWFNKIDLKRYPFIYINDDKWNM